MEGHGRHVWIDCAVDSLEARGRFRLSPIARVAVWMEVSISRLNVERVIGSHVLLVGKIWIAGS